MSGRLVRESKRNLKGNHGHDRLLELLETVLSRRRNGSEKVCSIHEPEVQCIGKGKEHKKHEFGNKVSIIRSATGIILGAMSFRNEHDGHAIGPSLEQAERLTGRKIKVPAGDRGYGGKKEIDGTRIVIPDIPKKSDGRHQRLKRHELFRKRAGMEPSIGRLKSDCRLARNFYNGVAGDAVNVFLAAATYNFKRAMEALWYLLQNICEILLRNNISQNWTF